ncbi:cytochrome P450 [Sciscionella marina]|uniref:cytochrome P450 n=1 Tax=Sciscionella marina TaxID=508770 RepID=UPI000370D74B|nr:cytochrome P450 [Sciscionella marina]
MSQILTTDVLSPDVYANGDPEKNGLPLDGYERLRQDAPCYRHKLDDPLMIDEIWVVSRHADIVRVDKDAELFSSMHGVSTRVYTPENLDMGGKPAMIGLDGDQHRRNRGVVSKAFTPKVVKTFEEQFREMSRRIVQRAVAKGSFDFVSEIAVEMPLNAICDLMGVPAQDRPQFLKWVNAFTVTTDPNYAPSPEEAMIALGNIWEYGLDLADHRRQEPGDDLMSLIVRAKETLSDDEIQGFIFLLAGAGSDTTRNAFSHSLHGLMRNPEQMRWLREHADDVPSTAIQEIVRWATPVIHFARTVTRDTEIAGQPIAEGEKVAMLFGSGNFDPSVVEDPLRFDLTRERSGHVSFGVGPHSCLGKHIAALEIKILFEELLQHTKEIQPTGPIGYVRDNFLRGVHTLPVKTTPA